MKVVRYHVTVLSNILTGYDKYKRTYSKKDILHSTYPDEFYLLRKEDLFIGFEKASNLLLKLNVKDNRIIVLETEIDNTELFPNLRNGKGEYVKRNWIKVEHVYLKEGEEIRKNFIEDIISQSYQLKTFNHTFDTLVPRSVSILPVAKGCQAKCNFCFSEASISEDQEKGLLSPPRIREVLQEAKKSGAERAVITGGGEPGILKRDSLTDLIRLCAEFYDKTVLISNGYFLAKSKNLSNDVKALGEAGLSILAISRHHFDCIKNFEIMGLDIALPDFRKEKLCFEIRYICVLQKNGIETKEDVMEYIDWAYESGVASICFKELYISSSTESVYYDKVANEYCKENQIPLSIILELAEENKWCKTGELPWSSPIYTIPEMPGLTIAAYTEPSVSWELQNGICRSWNLMADGTCYASLESRESKVLDYEFNRI